MKPWYVGFRIGTQIKRKDTGEKGKIILPGILKNFWIIKWVDGGRTAIETKEIEETTESSQTGDRQWETPRGKRCDHGLPCANPGVYIAYQREQVTPPDSKERGQGGRYG